MEIKEAQEAIFKELGIENLPQEKKEELLFQMTETLIKRILVEIDGKLDPNQKEFLSTLVDRDKDFTEINSFLKEKVADYDTLVERIIREIIDEIKVNK